MQFISNRSVLCKEVFGTPSVELRVSDKQMSMSPSIAMKKNRKCACHASKLENCFAQVGGGELLGSSHAPV